MAFPTHKSDLIPAGYRFEKLGRCRGCGADIEWWFTPALKRIPMNPMASPQVEAVSHFATCPTADRFRRKT